MYLVTLDITSIDSNKINTFTHRRDRIVVSTLRCGRNNPGSNPGHGTLLYLIQRTNDGTGRIQNISVGFDDSGIQQVNQSTC